MGWTDVALFLYSCGCFFVSFPKNEFLNFRKRTKTTIFSVFVHQKQLFGKFCWGKTSGSFLIELIRLKGWTFHPFFTQLQATLIMPWKNQLKVWKLVNDVLKFLAGWWFKFFKHLKNRGVSPKRKRIAPKNSSIAPPSQKGWEDYYLLYFWCQVSFGRVSLPSVKISGFLCMFLVSVGGLLF